MTETREAPPSHLVFKIESFSLLKKHNIPTVYSPEFAAGDYKWQLMVDLNDVKSGKDGEFISVKLGMSDILNLPANLDVIATFSIFLFNHTSTNYLYSQGETRRFLAPKLEWRIPEFISKKVLMDSSNGYLVDDNCVVGAEVFVLKNSPLSKCLSLNSVPTLYNHNIKISNFSKIKPNRWTSDKFTTEGQNWVVEVYPKGIKDGLGTHVSIYLRYTGSQGVLTKFKICLKNHVTGNQKIYTENCHFFPANTTFSWGWQKFIEASCVKDPKNGFILKDCLFLEIEISLLGVMKEIIRI